MKKIVIWFFITALIASIIFVNIGCKQGSTESIESTEAQESIESTEAQESTGQPIYGGVLKVAYTADPMNLDPYLVTSTYDRVRANLMFDYLWIQNRERDGYEPRLAKEWEWTDEDTLEIILREGVSWSNGKEFTSEDVKFSLERILNPETGAVRKANFEAIDSIEIVDKYKLAINFKNYYPTIIPLLAFEAIITSDAVPELNSGSSIGIGPFLFQKWDKGSKIVYEKNPNYWDKGKPYLDGIEFYSMEAYTTQKQALMAGDIDLIDWPDLADFESLSNLQGIKLYAGEDSLLDLVEYIGINVNRPIVNNPKIREAIKLAIDSQEMIDTVLSGMGSVAYVPMSKNDPFYNLDWEWEQDIEKAKTLIAEVYPDGIKEPLIIGGCPSVQSWEEALQGQLQRVGIPSELNIVDNSAYLDLLINKEDWDLNMVGDFYALGDPTFFASKYFNSEGSMNAVIGSWKNDKVDSLLEEYMSPHTQEERVQIIDEIYKIVLEENPVIFWAYYAKVPAMRDYVNNYYMNGQEMCFYHEIWMDNH